jgi:hypothetical protein
MEIECNFITRNQFWYNAFTISKNENINSSRGIHLDGEDWDDELSLYFDAGIRLEYAQNIYTDSMIYWHKVDGDLWNGYMIINAHSMEALMNFLQNQSTIETTIFLDVVNRDFRRN